LGDLGDQVLGRLFKKKHPSTPVTVIVTLNARLQPMHRGEFFEDPLDASLRAANLGEVSGGGTLQQANGEIECCDIELQVPAASKEVVDAVLAMLERLDAPIGSKLVVETTGEERAFGKAEGLGIYLNGTDLPDDTYQKCDSNVVLSEVSRLLDGKGRVLSHWQGPTETAFYLYGESFDEMKSRIADFLVTYPLCDKCRLERIA
jgi:hypothetical protein